MSRFLRIRNAIADCESHMTESGIGEGAPIQSYLTQYLMILLCAEMQDEIAVSVKQYTDKLNDRHVKNFIDSALLKIFRSTKVNEISGLLANFGTNVKDSFNSKVDETAVSAYSNVVIARHQVAHSRGATITFSELKQAVDCAAAIICAVDEALAELHLVQPKAVEAVSPDETQQALETVVTA